LNFKDLILNNPVFSNLATIAQKTGKESYLIGGYVRDLILKRESKDIDVVCIGSGIEFAEAFAAMYPDSHLSVYKNFGTALVKTADFHIEFVGARKESYRADSRKPIVENGTIIDDQNRRDFTINVMALSLNEDNLGELIDPFGGVEHLEKKIIKTPLEPNITFSDDPLRMMRAIRFATQLKFDISPETFEAIIQNAERIKIISAERIADELNKIILSETPSYGFKLLYHAQLLDIIFPEFVALKGAETKEGKGHKDNFYHTLQVLDNISESTDNLWLRWAAILHDIAKPITKQFNQKVGWTFHGHEEKGARMVPKLFAKLKLPLDEKMRYVQKLVRLHLRPISLINEQVTDSAVRRLLFECGDDIDDLMMLCRADITSKNPDKVRKYLNNFSLVEQRLKQVEELDKIRNFQPPVSGEIIMKTFNLQPSKLIGEIKDVIFEAILEGKIKNEYEAAYQLMLDEGLKRGLTKVV
jgi:poly(A) polymerase